VRATRLGYDLDALRTCLAGVGGDATVGPPRYRALHVLGRCASTNEEARELARRGAEDGTIVVADAQTAGRGRLDRSWHSPPGVGLYASVLVREPELGPRLTLLPLLVGVALADGIAALGVADAALKWPNDVLLGGRKLAGILCEFESPAGQTGGDGAVVLGVGVNVGHLLGDFPSGLREQATSLRLALGRDVARETVLCRFLAALGARLQAFRTPADFPWDAWRARSAVEGQPVRVEGPPGGFDGEALRVDPDGALVVRRTDGAELRVVAADVTLARTGGRRAGS
jgi:BirA family biotin operon repressor/biotin-[acetyl-CoA-carboxylase] ligase